MTTYVAGIDVGGTSVKLGLFTILGERIEVWNIPTDLSDTGVHIPQQVAESIYEKIDTLELDKEKFIGAGVGVPGFVRPADGVVKFAVNIKWRDYPAATAFNQALDRPVFVNNDANLATAGEVWRGAGKGAENAVCITLGTGVGAGLVVHGDILSGKAGTAGEFGHVNVVPGGRKCECGGYGCLESYASATGLVGVATEQLHEHKESSLHQIDTISAADIYHAADHGDQFAQKLIDDAGYYLGYAIANMATVLNPEKIIIGGGMSAAGDTLLQPVRKAFEQFVLPEAGASAEIAFAELGNEAGVNGGSWLAVKRLDRLPADQIE
ncbi:ROK family glucokinase [Salsuginibacillus kocurii]|uniref:ROK family glucokinase n=1 Tax=Salsuginibacillus kocurii TaxID=427078 RepID=UPI00037036C4|nr:ROK family glucokinase [Salsuginibacillus kocurii]